MAQITDAAANQGILGLFDIDRIIMKDFENCNAKSILLLDNISDPGNAGTLLRSALAFEFNTVLLTGSTVEILNPKVVRSSAGAIFGLKVARATSEILVRMKKEKSFTLIAADIKGMNLAEGLLKIEFDSPVMLAVGGEAEGLSSEISKLADLKLRIKHYDKVESLNAAVAGSIVMREIYQSRTGSKVP